MVITRLWGRTSLNTSQHTIINPATIYIVFSRYVRVYSKALKRHCSTSTVSFNNAVCRPAHNGLAFKINLLGASRIPLPCVAALTKGVTIGCELRLDQVHS